MEFNKFLNYIWITFLIFCGSSIIAIILLKLNSIELIDSLLFPTIFLITSIFLLIGKAFPQYRKPFIKYMGFALSALLVIGVLYVSNNVMNTYKHKKTIAEAKYELHELLAGCQKYWKAQGAGKPCAIANARDFGFSPQEEVTFNLIHTHQNKFVAKGKHRYLTFPIQIEYDGKDETFTGIKNRAS